jgi:hypothetical protein
LREKAQVELVPEGSLKQETEAAADVEGEAVEVEVVTDSE